MNKFALIFLAITIFSGCRQNYLEEHKEQNYIQTYSGIVRIKREYPKLYCDINLKSEWEWISHVDLDDCKKVNVGDTVVIVEKVENGLVTVRMHRINPNLP